MKMKRFCKVTLALAVAVSTMASVVCEASNLDTYRNLLMRKTYTIKYQEITPQARATNKDRINLYGKNSMDTSTSELFVNKPARSILVCDGDDKYEEIGVGSNYLASIGMKDMATCRLQKGKEVFNFTRYYDKDKLVYRGAKKGSVSAVNYNVLATLTQGDSFGTENMTRLLNAMLPDSRKPAGMPSFKFVGSGWLNNGLNYEDYRSDHNGMFEAVRYYFNGYTLVKIASATYYTNAKGELDGTRCIIKIDEFSPTPDKKYLSLPAGLKDTTKRKSEDK